ncbi:hypothetical protein D7X33_38535 [Butyricicoccus sp. 1XD8-22]|nr:hypothetical protein D7X33_38535 [Butyricicoccus sp. 1XD8-22]
MDIVQGLINSFEDWLAEKDKEFNSHIIGEVVNPTLWDLWDGFILILPDLVGFATMGTSIALMLGCKVLRTLGVYGGFLGLSISILAVN